MKKGKKKIIKIKPKKMGYLNVWSLVKQMNPQHPDFGTVVKFLDPSKQSWWVELND
jgi:hypothetical protein